MAEAKQTAYEGWGILELMGHGREVGYITTEAYGQAVLFRVDTPELPEREFVLTQPEYCQIDGSSTWCAEGTKVKRDGSPARSRLVAPGALYALNPCTEEAARTALERMSPRPLIAIDVPVKALLVQPRTTAEEEDDLECAECGDDADECSCPI